MVKKIYSLTKLGDEYYMGHINKIKAPAKFFLVGMNSGKTRLFLNFKRIFKVIMVYYDEIDGEKHLQ